MKFTYSSGQRPLDGFTVKRGVGHGGFGEVYFAVSDGGKEVALKLVKGHQDVELRGVTHCLNLKHPNLLHLYDLRTDSRGEPWLVMEYVFGETLGQVLNRHPTGLPVELARQWFLELARAVGHLHDHGIVHRDLKPGNIFLEDGRLKVGDYGLSKSISSSQHSPQTRSVGTVHYMAPEVSGGNYNKQVDVYAAGVILYEMLTGRVPFEGQSTAEILMKHLTAPPDLTRLPAEFVPIVGKALAKNPVQRYASMAELAHDVESLGKGDVPVVRPASADALRRVRYPDEPPPVPLPARSLRDQVGELSGSMALSAVIALVTTTVWAALIREGPGDWQWIGQLYFLTVALTWAVLVPAKFWTPRQDSWGRRLAMMGLGAGVGLLALWLDGWVPTRLHADHGQPFVTAVHAGREGLAAGAGYLSYFGLAFGALRWWRMAERRRSTWFGFFPVLAAGFWALALLFIWPWPERPYGAAALVTAALIVQWVSPWEAAPPVPPRKLRWRYA